MTLRTLAWLLVPLAGLLELALHCYYATRAPDPAAWAELSPVVEHFAHPDDLIAIAPSWAEPLARQTLGDDLMPLADVARFSDSGYAHALEVSLLNQRLPEFADWIELEQETHGKFTLRRLLNPHREPVIYAFNDHAEPPDLQVTEWNGEAQHECEFTRTARSSAGGLGGHVAYPKQRYRCEGGDPFLVGVTVIDDPEYRPRRCLYAHPPANAWLHVRFKNVPAGSKLVGYGGMSYLLAREWHGTPVEFAIYIDDKEIGRRLFEDSAGFTPFEYRVDARGRQHFDVTFEVQSKSTADREFCFAAELR